MYFLIFAIVASGLTYKIVDTAYGDAYEYDDYAYALGTTDHYDSESLQ